MAHSLSRRRFSNALGTVLLGAFAGDLSSSAASAEVLNIAFSDGNSPYSFERDGRCEGILSDLVQSVFEFLPDRDVSCTPFPWARAQAMVRENRMDGLCTYPSESRKKYLEFSPEPLFVQDIGYLAYNKSTPGIEKLTKVKSYEDLARFEFVGVNGVGWEVDNIPPTISRQLLKDLPTAFQILFRRQSGDFMVISVEQAIGLAKTMDFETSSIGFVRADFITNHLVPFHIGLRKNLPDTEKNIDRITEVIRSSDFRKRRKTILVRYRT